MDLDKKIKEFKKLDFEQKRTKCLSMLEVLKWSGSLFDDLYNIIKNIDDVSEELMVSIYSSIQSTISYMDDEKLRKYISDMEKVKMKLQKIKEMEKQEEKDNDPDKLLENI